MSCPSRPAVIKYFSSQMSNSGEWEACRGWIVRSIVNESCVFHNSIEWSERSTASKWFDVELCARLRIDERRGLYKWVRCTRKSHIIIVVFLLLFFYQMNYSNFGIEQTIWFVDRVQTNWRKIYSWNFTSSNKIKILIHDEFLVEINSKNSNSLNRCPQLSMPRT